MTTSWPTPRTRKPPVSPTRPTGSSRCGRSARPRGWARSRARPRRCTSASRPSPCSCRRWSANSGCSLFERSGRRLTPDPRGPAAVRAGAAAGRRPGRAGRRLPRQGAGAGRGRTQRRRRQLDHPVPAAGHRGALPPAPSRRAPDACTTSPAPAASTCCARDAVDLAVGSMLDVPADLQLRAGLPLRADADHRRPTIRWRTSPTCSLEDLSPYGLILPPQAPDHLSPGRPGVPAATACPTPSRWRSAAGK